MATRKDHAILKGPTLRIHEVQGGFLPVLLYWGRGKPEWYRYYRPFVTRAEAEQEGYLERRRMRRQPHHYFKWPGDPWQMFDGEVAPLKGPTTLKILKEFERTGPLAGVASIMREMEEERIREGMIRNASSS